MSSHQLKDAAISGVGSVGLLLLLVLIGLDLSDQEVPHTLIWMEVFVLLATLVLVAYKQNMFGYVLGRILESLVTVFIVASLTFILLRLIPGGPFDEEKPLPPEVKANIEAKYNLNQPLYLQYLSYMKGLLQGDLGQSYKYIGRNVSDIITESFPISFQLGLYSLLLGYLIGIPLGLTAANYHNRWQDSAIMTLAISGVSLPAFLVAPLLILPLAIYNNWLPAALWESPLHYLLPVVTLGLRPAGVVARLTRASVLDNIGMDYVRTAMAKGLPRTFVLYKHVLRNSLIPVLTLSGPLIAGILTGSFVVEQMFAIPGLGKHLVQSVTNRDYPLILGLTLVYSVLLVFANLVVDILYGVFDPRIKLK